jgi:hypothetical protein
MEASFMTKPTDGSASHNHPKVLPGRQTTEDLVEESSEESFPASDSPAWNASHEAAPALPSPVQTDKTKQGCAVSFLTEERNEMDKLCERTSAEQREEYTQPDEEKEVGGEG